jgi:prepilin signal peptidase PulO-like enzyme (type II secretory pathway)
MYDPHHLPLCTYLLGDFRAGLMHVTPGLPPGGWWLPATVLVLLGLAAIVDALTATVPDALIFLGLGAVIAAQGTYVSWPFAGWHLALAIGAAILVWSMNDLWRAVFDNDAIGMGDAKWTMLAVSCFDLNPVLAAWGIGAWLALIWIGAAWASKYKLQRVYFAPFLFLGLLASIYLLRLR